MFFRDDKIKIIALLIMVMVIMQIKDLFLASKEDAASGEELFSEVQIDLDKIRQRGKLIALTDNSSTSYFIYKGEPMGFEYDLLNDFAEHLGVELEIIIAKNMDEIFEQLKYGEADIVAANLTITEERLQEVDFSVPLMLTRQILIQQKPEGWQRMSEKKLDKALVRNTVDLVDKKVHVRKGSSFYSRLQNLSEEIGGQIQIEEASGAYETEELIGMVADGSIEYTVADENVALINKTYHPNIDIKTAISFPQKIAWAVRKSSSQLKEEIDNWLINKKNTKNYVVLYNKYFRNTKEASRRVESEYFAQVGARKISPYDKLIKSYSQKIDWDWRLLASMICQESRFDPQAKSWVGAYGLMQIIPSTSVELGIDSVNATPEESIDAGTRYIKSLDNYWMDYIPEYDERVKFILASYNVGLGHIIDARNLAVKYDKNPTSWESGISYFVLNKSKPKYYNDPIVKYGYCRGEEPYKYVKQILSRYEHYKNVFDPAQREDAIASK